MAQQTEKQLSSMTKEELSNLPGIIQGIYPTILATYTSLLHDIVILYRVKSLPMCSFQLDW